jgi:hypothetical protein
MDRNPDPYRTPITEAVDVIVPSIVPVGNRKEYQDRDDKEAK